MSSAIYLNHHASEASSVKIADLEGRGRAVVASKILGAGEIVLRDSPILLYSALPLKPEKPQNHHYCTHCFRVLSNPSIASCSSCSASFCNPTCSSLAQASSHTPWVCQALSRLRDTPPSPEFHHDSQVQARFLVAAFNLAVGNPSSFRTLLRLQGASPSQPDDTAVYLHSLIFALCPPPPPSTEISFSLELTAALLAKDKLNAFGLMEPFLEDGERSVRAYGIYPNASFFNHDCLPNACRFDYVDAPSQGNTDIIVRLIHDIPQGREICVSYFPVNLNFSERQRRLREDYGFICACDRCKVEANWSDDEEEQGNLDKDEEEEAMDEDDDEAMEDSETEDDGVKEEDNFPHSYFFVRYMCSRNNCWGTLAPLPIGNGAPSTTMECNVCGTLRNDEEAMDGDNHHIL